MPKQKSGEVVLTISPSVVAVALEELKGVRNRAGNVHTAGGAVIRLSGEWLDHERFYSSHYQATVKSRSETVDLEIVPETDQDAFVHNYLTMTNGEEIWRDSDESTIPMPEWVQRTLGHLGIEPYPFPVSRLEALDHSISTTL